MANMFINAMTDLWNSAGTTYSAIKMNVTNSASSATSKLIHMQVGGVDKFTVDKSGNIYSAGVITGTGNSNPSADDAASLGSLSTAWSDLYLASGGFIAWTVSGATDVTITHSSNLLTFAGATSGYAFTGGPVVPATDDASALGTTLLGWSDLYVASTGTIHFGNTDWVAAHTPGILTVGTGDLRVTTAGTNAASVVTVGGTQTLTGKTLTSPTITTGALNGTIGATTPSTGQFTTVATSAGIAAGGSIVGSPTVAAWGSSGNVHFWLYGPANEDRCVIYTSSTSAGHAYLRVNGTATYTFQNDGSFLAPGSVAASGYVYASGGFFIGANDVVLASGSTGIVYLRPNGHASTTGQTAVDTNGAISCWGDIWARTGTAGTDFGLQIASTVRHFRFSGGYSWAEDTTTGNIILYMAGGTKAHFDLAANFVVYGAAYKPGGGSWANSSDARIKTVNGDYTTGLEAVLALRPVRYVYKGNDTPEEPRSYSDPSSDLATRSTDAPTVPYPNSTHYVVAQEGKEFVGFVAQEAETVMPDIVTTHAGFIDGEPVADIRDIDTSRLIFALVNAVKELSAKVEALEAGS